MRRGIDRSVVAAAAGKRPTGGVNERAPLRGVVVRHEVRPDPRTGFMDGWQMAEKAGREVAGELGFEPRLTESESAVLPLNYSPIRKRFQ